MDKIVQVIVYNITNKIDHIYDYVCPFEGETVGKRVIVPFGKSNTPRKAMIVAEKYGDANGLKSVYMFLDEVLVLTPLQLSLAAFLKERYFIPYFKAIGCLLPTGLDYKVERKYCYTGAEVPLKYRALIDFIESKKKPVSLTDLPEKMRSLVSDAVRQGMLAQQVKPTRNLGDLADKMMRLSVSSSRAEEYIGSLTSRNQGQIDILQMLMDSSAVSVKEALYMTGASSSVIKTLEKNDLIQVFLQQRLRDPYEDAVKNIDTADISLTDEQQIVFNGINDTLQSGSSIHLIHGITGSGKTLIYMKLIDETVKNGKSVLFLVPEISLTPQTLSRFYARYGEKVAVLHSGLSMGQRMDEWKKIRSMSCSVVVGTRSAVFAPVRSLGLIIMDEEHEASYKSESSPKYHAKEIAKFLSLKTESTLVLGSATPSLESYYAASKEKYILHSLTKRYNDKPLPQVEMVDMRKEFNEGNTSFLSVSLQNSLRDVIAERQQAILFLNRRGAHTNVICQNCGFVLKCPNCGISMTYHSANNRCLCHFCSYSINLFDACPTCGSKHIKMRGMGTQLAETELKAMYPDARILRMDMDTVANYISYQQMLSDFEQGKYDILLGTQMVAKGLNFPNVTLVGVLQADLSLYIEDFRAGERTFSLLTQVCGRSGRAEKSGKAIIQSYSPEHEVLKFAEKQDYISFYDYEIKFRKAINYPPFCDIALFSISGMSHEVAFKAAAALFESMQMHAQSDASDIPLRLLRPNVPRIEKINQKYRMQLIVKCVNSVKFRRLAQLCMSEIEGQYHVTVGIDINPLSFQ